ncbi:beta-glucosidase-9 [Coleophoma cylindrospora]|uniref:Probable beta-glucosidase G n=1 Tax=Coleophoma cylindrospora TaxID=1849047 RepID=A0A3D8S8L7_9HELO|nr:beta-glucosidase-9 [Coleophoma cylindrospora]
MAPLLDLAAVILACAAGVSGEAWNSSLFTSSPDVFPSPQMSGIGGWEAAMAKANAFLANMTLQEKTIMLTGANGPCVGNISPIPRLGFKGLCLQDGPASVREATYVSVFPAGLTTAASWDRDLMKTRGIYMGQEFRDKGSHVYLGPVAGPLGRSALSGRNWEGFSPDPYLTGVAMEETITGVQSTGVQASAKHFVAYEQETMRNPPGTFEATTIPNSTEIQSISSNVEDRTLHELYLWPFANAVRAGVANVMCSYNRVNSTWASQNSKLLNGLLKTELGFQGYVVSDWMAVHTGVDTINAGLDMNMPGQWNWAPIDNTTSSWWGPNLTVSVNNGSVSASRIDDMVRRVLTPYFFLGQDQDFPTIDPSMGAYPMVDDFEAESYWLDSWTAAGVLGSANRDVRGNHSTLIRELGAAGTVLLKNTNGALPLKAPSSIGVFGNAAGDLTTGPYYHADSYEYGCLPIGGGSGSGRFSYLVAPLEAIKAQANKDGSAVTYILNNTQLAIDGGASTIYPVPEVCLVFLKTWAAEGTDRDTLHVDYDGDSVVEQVASYCNNTVVVSQSTGINVMPWASNPNVTAIVISHLSGNEIGNSLVDILYGVYNPSGKLPYSIAHNESDYSFAPVVTSVANTTDPNAWQSDFTERLLIDYRYFDYNNISVLYEFGFGLSYTTFDLANISISKLANSTIASLPAATNVTAPGGKAELWDALYSVTVSVSNTGSLAGATVPQLYVTLPATAGEGTPVQQLRGFDKISLEAGETKTVTFELMRRDLSVWDTLVQEWRIPSGDFGVKVGFSSRDAKVQGTFTI